MERQTRQPTDGHKRPNEDANHEFRTPQSRNPAQLSVSHAEASGSSRMLTGTVGGDNVHGNVTHVTNYYNSDGTSGDPEPREQGFYHSYSSKISDLERETLFTKLHFPQLDARLTNLRRAGRRTCEWLSRRKAYREWMGIESNGLQAQDGLFWIRGNPGTGKSIAMKFLFQQMQHRLETSHDELVFSFFFNARGSDLEKSTLGLYRSLLFGLLSSDSSLLEVLNHCSKSQCLSILYDSGEWEQKHERLLQELCEKAVELLAERKKRLYCYVDALDECPENQIRDMVTYFEDVMAEGKSRNIRVCFSSRHYPRISIKTKRTITLEHESSHNDDIKTYISSELRFDEHTAQVDVERLRDAIFQKSAGIFLWVSLVVRQLNDVFDNDGRMDAIWERLEEIPRAAKETPVSHGDLPLYGLFHDVIMKDTRNIPDLIRLTQIIFCAKRLLSPQEAYVALKRSYHKPFDAENVKFDVLSKHILAVSKGLAEVTSDEEPTVQFIHETVREFLRDGGLATISRQSMHSDGNELLKVSCLEQIKVLDSVAEHSGLLADYRTWTRYRNKQDEGILASEREEFREQISQIFPFLAYATQYVLWHGNAAAEQGVPQRSFLDSFPSPLWVPLHNLFEKANTERFFGSDTPELYILAGHGLNDLVRISTNQWKYAAVYKNEQCPTALHNAIYSGHLDTARVLVGLGPKERYPKPDGSSSSLSDCGNTLLKAIIYADDVDIFRTVIRDHGIACLQPQGEENPSLILNDCRSVAMIDCLAEHLMLPGIGPANGNAQNKADVGKHISPTSGLFFTHREIHKHPSLLTETVWGNYCILDYAIEKRFLPLFTLYLELMPSRSAAALNDCLSRVAMAGWLVAIKEAYFRGVALDCEDESGRTVLHKMFAGDYFTISSPEEQRAMCSVLQYLLLKNNKLGASVDRDGYTAFDLIRNGLWDFRPIRPGIGRVEDMKVVEVFIKAGATTKTGFICEDHQYPWVVVPCISIELSIQLDGGPQFTNLDARDSLGRTALSWCFWGQPGVVDHCLYWFHEAAGKGTDLLRCPEVDVNSRDNAGRTILEHLIRHPRPYQGSMQNLTVAFFKSSNLDVNLETSDGHSPLDLIVSLFGTWPVEFGEIDAEWVVPVRGRIKGVEKKFWLSDCLLSTARLLLATRRVHLSEQKRCLAKAPDYLRDVLLQRVKEVEPDYRLQTVSDAGQQGNHTMA